MAVVPPAVWPITIGGACNVTYTQQQAHEVLAGFAFGVTALNWVSPLHPPLAPQPVTERYRWGYRTFDCAPSSPYNLPVQDLAITGSLNSRVSGDAIVGMLAMADQVTAVVNQIPVHQTFWTLPVQAIANRPANPGSVEWHFWRAWELLMGIPHVGTTVTHKTLHHMRPWLYPMLDDLTAQCYPAGQWAGIHADLTQHVGAFADLESWFAVLASRDGGVALTRLRIHDMLLWASRSGQRPQLALAGQAFLGGGGAGGAGPNPGGTPGASQPEPPGLP